VKLFELENQYHSKPLVYVDMDGVLADFFGEIARKHGVEYWREIHRQDIGIDQIAKQPEFFETLPTMPNARNLLQGIIKIAGTYSILSSPLLSNVEQSSEEKANWLDKYIRKDQPQAVIFDHEKYRYAQQPDETPNILIDDWETNIRLWESHGGIGILHVDADWKLTLQKLRDALHGQIRPSKRDPIEEEIDSPTGVGKLFTSRQVLKYVQGIHHDYHLEKPILASKVWVLGYVPVSTLKTPEYVHQDDPYRRVIDINWDHIDDVSSHNVNRKPIVIDADGWVLDGNHRAMAAQARGLDQILALMPYNSRINN
jgi:5'(3')-deoxyribonucleotidase